MTTEMIEKYINAGMKRWTNGDYDRLYINMDVLGLECEYHKSGRISHAELNGESISNRRATAYKWAKTYIDIKTGKLYSTNSEVKEMAKTFIQSLEA